VIDTAARRRLGFAAAAVLLTAADTYVVVLALPAIIGDLGIGLDRLQAATPIVSGFLLGYVVVLPLLGRLSDLIGRYPVFLGCLAIFAAGSLTTASAHELSVAVAGRALQGLGGGGMVPVTLALVADMWPPQRRGIPLGVVGAVQELGSVLGPLYGAAILTVSTWRTIFWVNLPLSAVVALGLVASRPRVKRSSADVGLPSRRFNDWIGIALLTIAVTAGALSISAPGQLVDNEAFGTAFVPLAGTTWLTPLLVAAVTAAAAFVAWEVASPAGVRALVPTKRLAVIVNDLDWLGAVLLAAVLAAVVIAFSTADPSRQAISPAAAWLLPIAALCVALFVARERRTPHPLVELSAFRNRSASGALLTNLATGAALMAALVDVPILARVTVYPNSQLGAASVLLRLLAAVPIGAVAGGWLCQRAGNRGTAALGLAVVSAMFAVMTRWSTTTLADPLGASWLHPSDPVLVLAGLGFGLAIAPINAAMLGAVRASLHGLASALVVVARMIGMLVGISVLTAVGLRAFFDAQSHLPAPQALCPRAPLNCAPYNTLVTAAAVDELRVVFLGASLCAAVAAVTAAALLRGRPAARSLREALIVS